MMTPRQRIIAQVDAEIAKSGMLDAVKTPEDQKSFETYRQTLIESQLMIAKLEAMPKP